MMFKGIAAFMLLAGSMSAQAASFYNCASNTGCVKSTVATTSTYTQTRYPVVFAHGMAGFNSLAGVNYWYQIPEALAAGGATVFVTKQASFNSSDVRGEQFRQQVLGILALTGAPRVNIMGHSHGGQSIRYALATLPSGTVASVTSIGSPHKGSPVADLIQQVANNPSLGGLTGALSTAVNGLGSLINLLSGNDPALKQDSLAGLASLSTAGSAEFNARFPLGVPATACGEGSYTARGAQLYSWSGTGGVTNALDPLDQGLNALKIVFKEPSDGLVGQCSSHFGRVLRDNYNMNHLDEVNQLLGLVSLLETNPKTVYRTQTSRLKLQGL